MYDYVSRSEYAPARKEFEIIIKKAQQLLKKRNGITFQFRLVGSGSRHLVMRLKGGNKGFDLDYNLILFKSKNGYDPDYIRQVFLTAFNDAVRGTHFIAPKSSTSAITIEYVDTKSKKIVYSCDLAIVQYDTNFEDDGYYINKRVNNKYDWVFRSNTIGLNSKINDIKAWNSKMWWVWIKDEYKTVKNSNKDPNKHSFSLYAETVCNVHNQIQQEKKSNGVGEWPF